jgi:hypothetical protein
MSRTPSSPSAEFDVAPARGDRSHLKTLLLEPLRDGVLEARLCILPMAVSQGMTPQASELGLRE